MRFSNALLVKLIVETIGGNGSVIYFGLQCFLGKYAFQMNRLV